MSSNASRRHYLNRGGPPNDGRIPPASAAAPTDSAPRRHYLSRGGPPNNGRVPTANPASAPAPAASSSDAPAARRHYLNRGGPPNSGRVPTVDAATALSAEPPASRRHYLARGGPPSAGRIPGASSATAPPVPSTPAAPAVTAPLLAFPPGTFPPGVWAQMFAGNIPIMTAPSPPPSPNPAPPAAGPSSPPVSSSTALTIAQTCPASASSGNTNFSILLHPRSGYCTFALLPQGFGAADEQIAAGLLPTKNYLGHPMETVGDLIRGLYGEGVEGNEGEVLAREVGVAEYKEDGGVMKVAKRYKLDDGDEEMGKRCKEVGWTGGSKVLLAWGRGGMTVEEG